MCVTSETITIRLPQYLLMLALRKHRNDDRQDRLDISIAIETDCSKNYGSETDLISRKLT